MKSRSLGALSVSMGVTIVVFCSAYVLRSSRIQDTGEMNQVFDFGDAREGDRIRHIFQVRNPYTTTLTISRVASSCGCTVLKSPPTVIPAGGSADFPVEINLGGKPEHFSSVVAVQFNEGTSATFRTKGTVILEIPKEIRFMGLLKGEQPTKELPIRGLAGHAVHVKSLIYNRNLFAVTSETPQPNSLDAMLSIRVLPDVGYGPFADTLQVITDDGNRPIKRVRINGSVRPLVEVTPP